MSYDPRQGSSPYLGMDGDGEDRTRLTDAERAAEARTRRAEVATTTRADVPRTERAVRAVRTDARDAAATRAEQPLPRAATAEVPATIRRPSRAVAPRPRTEARVAGARQAGGQAPYAVPSPRQQPYHEQAAGVPPQVSSRLARPFRLLGSVALRLLALVLRLLALAFAAFVVASAFLTDAHRATLVGALNLASWLVPAPILGQFVFETPFGGAFRGDLVLASIILFCADWICIRFSTSLRHGRERGA